MEKRKKKKRIKKLGFDNRKNRSKYNRRSNNIKKSNKNHLKGEQHRNKGTLAWTGNWSGANAWRYLLMKGMSTTRKIKLKTARRI